MVNVCKLKKLYDTKSNKDLRRCHYQIKMIANVSWKSQTLKELII